MSGFLSLQWNNHSLAFLNLLNSLHSKELYCDATIACHGKFYPVHRMVLSTCSEYFQEIFNLTQCKHPFIIINDAQPSQLEALLEYMYKGNINVPQKDLPNLLKAAEGLRIKGLAVPDNLSTDKELSKKRSSSQTSSSKKLKVSNKEKEDNDSRRGSLNNDSKDTPDTNVFEDNRECIIEENPPIKQEPIDPENNDAVTKSKLGNELPNNIDENVVKSEPYDPSYADAHQNQVQLQYPNNTEWALNNGNDQINQQSYRKFRGIEGAEIFPLIQSTIKYGCQSIFQEDTEASHSKISLEKNNIRCVKNLTANKPFSPVISRRQDKFKLPEKVLIQKDSTMPLWGVLIGKNFISSGEEGLNKSESEVLNSKSQTPFLSDSLTSKDISITYSEHSATLSAISTPEHDTSFLTDPTLLETSSISSVASPSTSTISQTKESFGGKRFKIQVISNPVVKMFCKEKI